eukprot:Nk52_evm3s89 gene=Nk52_evmTU3s89
MGNSHGCQHGLSSTIEGRLAQSNGAAGRKEKSQKKKEKGKGKGKGKGKKIFSVRPFEPSCGVVEGSQGSDVVEEEEVEGDYEVFGRVGEMVEVSGGVKGKAKTKAVWRGGEGEEKATQTTKELGEEEHRKGTGKWERETKMVDSTMAQEVIVKMLEKEITGLKNDVRQNKATYTKRIKSMKQEMAKMKAQYSLKLFELQCDRKEKILNEKKKRQIEEEQERHLKDEQQEDQNEAGGSSKLIVHLSEQVARLDGELQDALREAEYYKDLLGDSDRARHIESQGGP